MIFRSNVLFLLLLAATVGTACTQEAGNQTDANESQSESITQYVDLAPSEYKMMMTEKPGILVDVRTPEEVGQGKIPTAINMNYFDGDFKGKLASLDHSETIYVYCRTGRRSSSAAQQLNEMGFTNVYNLAGGITAWKSAGLEVQ